MNPVEQMKKTKVSYNGVQNSVLKYMSMRQRMGKPLVTLEEIQLFFPNKITRIDTLQKMLKNMEKNNFIKTKGDGYIITNIGKQIPNIVANYHQARLVRDGKRTTYAVDDDWRKGDE